MNRTLTLLAALVAATPALAADKTAAAPDWEIAGQWMDTCSCTLPCPCWKAEKPTMGKACHEMYYFHIDKGHYGKVKLDGVDVVEVALSPDGKSMDQAAGDKDYQLVNLYLPKALAPEVLDAAQKLFTEFTMVPLDAGKKHAVKKVEMKASLTPAGARVTIPKVLDVDVKRTAKPYAQDTKVVGFLGAGVTGEQRKYDFSDDGVSWKLKNRNATFAPFSWSATQQAAAMAAMQQQPPPKK